MKETTNNISKGDKKIITFTLNVEMKNQLHEVLKNSPKYNLKMKSQWVNEAIEYLKGLQDYQELVLNADGNGEDFVADKIYMDYPQRVVFSEMRTEIVRRFPDSVSGPQGAIIRAAILNRLMRKF